jgi:hypothetical protein
VSDLRFLLDKFIPQIVIIGNRFEPRRQPKMMSMRRQELHAKRVDRSKKRATERFDSFEWKAGFENPLARALLHFISGTIRVSGNHKLRQPFKRALPIFRYLYDAVGDRARFAGAGGSDH